MSPVLKKSTPEKFAYICHFQQIGINATKTEITEIHFKTDCFFAAVAVVDAKAPWLIEVEERMASVRAQEKVFNFDASFSISDDKLLHSLTLRRGLYKRRFFRISLTGCFNFAIYTHRRESEIKRSSLVARAEILNPDLK